MSGLTNAERDTLAAAMHDAFQGWKGDPRGTTCGDCQDDASMLAPFVEQIIAARVTAALTDAADLMSNFLHDPECESCDDVRDCIEIVRAAIGGLR